MEPSLERGTWGVEEVEAALDWEPLDPLEDLFDLMETRSEGTLAVSS